MRADISCYPEFSEAIKNKSLVYLFGTGISSALTGKAFSWKKWVVDGITHMHNRALAEQYSTMLQSETSADILIYVVGNVILETKNNGTYSQWMNDSFEVNPITDTALTETLKKMLLTQDVFVTTNYDTLLEQATGLETLSYESPDRAFDMLDKKKNSAVLHIHGVYDSKECIDNIIASQEQYDQILNNEGAQFIQHILGTRTLVFIGCGQTADDVNISRFIEFAKRYLNMDQKYFFLCKNDSVPNDMPDNIIIVPYGDNYSDLPEFLENMIQIRLRTLVEKNPIIGRTSFEPKNDFSDSLLQYHYSQQKIPFCGRKNELYELDKFIVDDNKFQWWAITGQAGSGKSRLALELIRRLPSTWFGFFIDDKSSQCDVQSFVPFSDTLVVIDYVSGRESIVADYMRLLSETFEKFSYNLRILLIERDNCKKVGSWYAKLKQRFGKYDVLAEAENQEEFLNIVDLDDESVESFIGAVCFSKGLSPDSKRDMSLRVAYGKKFEKLRFRPLYVQIFVEAWIDNGGELPRYDSFDDLLEYTLKREQERWLLSLDGDQVCCNAVIRLLLRANISGSLGVAKLPDYYKKDWDIVHGFINTHSFPGEQRSEMQNSIINAICQNIDTNNYEITPLFPDIIKEYMFFFYADEEKLQEVLQELWENAAHEFSVFITRCLTDFPNNDFFRRVLNTYEINTTNEDVLLGRLELLNKTTINEEDDPYTLIDIIYNEYDFWESIVVPTDDAEKAEHISTLKFVGLDKVATRLGGWSMYNMTPMIEVIEEALKVRGSEGLEKIKQLALHKHITALAQTSFLDEASYLKEKLESYVSEDPLDEFSNFMHMCDRNVEMMDCIMSEIDFKKAVKVLKQMDSECLYSCIDSARTMAHSCFNIDALAFQLEKYSYIGVGDTIIRKVELLYPDDWNIRSWVLGCHTVQLQKKLFVENNISNAEFKIGVEELEEKLDTMKFGQESSDEALAVAWSTIKTLKLNVIDKDEKVITDLITETDKIISAHPNLDVVVATRIMALHVLHKDIRKDKVSHEEVEKVFKYVEQCPDSNCVRDAFFNMLKDSEVAGNRDNYLTKKVVQGAIQGARYDPLVGSGIPGFDMAAEIQRMGHLVATNNLPYRRMHKKVGANDPCPCGSGKKFKKCCRGNGKYD